MRKVNISEPKVTRIEHLPELLDVDLMSSLPNKRNGLTLEQDKKVNSKIRQPFSASPYSGMNIGMDVDNKNDSSSRIQARQNLVVNTSQENINFNTADHSSQKENHNIPNQSQDHFQSQSQSQSQSQAQSQALKEHFNMPFGSPSCLDVAEHISKCPICSKFYNTDKTIYIIAIITLAIICILLLKKVLDV
jgi:hypothetical protein